MRPRVALAISFLNRSKEPTIPTFVIAPDLVALYAAPRTTVDKWRAKGWLGEPAAHASDTDIYILEHVRSLLAVRLARPAQPCGRIPTARVADPAVLAAIRTRATVPAGVIPAGAKEIGHCLHVDPRRVPAGFQGRGARGRVMPSPIAILGPPTATDGRPARRVTVWDLRAFASWPGFDRQRGAELAERNEIRAGS